MPAPRIVLDGSMPYGTRVLTINAVSYKANDINIARPITTAEDNNIDGTPNRARYTAQRYQLTANLQLATSATARPAPGQTFSDTFDPTYGVETFVITEAPYVEDNEPGNIRTVAITAMQVVNKISVITA